VVAVHVLTHEAMHLSGRLGECAAVQRDAHTARLLGAGPADAAAPAGAYWRNIYPLMPGGYRSGDRRPGWPLDEGLADAVVCVGVGLDVRYRQSRHRSELEGAWECSEQCCSASSPG
jgi:hypothetical protein